ncbi:phosducin-like protein [Rhizoctonia solani]|uniref:Phosducin-like protein n=1 Tax=Rhizoctonia solani TaxID=456999 RepID=A0A8H8P806_9AGAM|nr:phosducin-like protein [Rhizoctonia solani]QRW27229.1 phosducin-like protein [Rhizoctonia solani]
MQNPNEDTEWNDILRKHGIIPERPKTPPSPPPPPSPTIAEKLGGASDSALKELEDDAGDSETERIVQEYRRKRMQEFRKEQKRGRFGEMMPIGRDDYKREVTEASRVDEEGMEGRGFGQPVVCYLYKDGDVACSRLTEHLKILAARYPSTKFVSIIGNKCIENYPDRHLPTLFFYRNGNPVSQVTAWGTDRPRTIQEIESILRALGMIPEKAPAQPRANREDSGSEDEVQRLSSTLRGTKLREPKQGTGTVNAQTSKIRGPSKPTVEDDDSDFDL